MKSLEKLESFFERYTREKQFQDRILIIRQRLGIPPEGVPLPDNVDLSYVGSPVSLLGIKYEDINYATIPSRMDDDYKEIIRPLPKIYKTLVTIAFINGYILYNKRIYDVFHQFYNHIEGSVSIKEFREDFLECEGVCDSEICPCQDYMQEVSEKFPVIVGISPYASQNEVIDLIKERWDYIQFKFQDMAKDGFIPPFEDEKKLLSRLRKREVISQKVEDAIYRNKHLSLKEICLAVKKETGVMLDPGEAGKIKSLAIQRRERAGK
jgi:hypothetical protein